MMSIIMVMVVIVVMLTIMIARITLHFITMIMVVMHV